MGNIGHVRLPKERKQMVFAERKEIDILLDNHLLVVFGEEGIVDDLSWIHPVSAGKIG